MDRISYQQLRRLVIEADDEARALALGFFMPMLVRVFASKATATIDASHRTGILRTEHMNVTRDATSTNI